MTAVRPVAQPVSQPSFRAKQRLGFNARVSFSDDVGPAQGLRDGIELFKAAEALGYQSGWAYQRHFDHYLSSPLPFFAAVGQHTHRITLGTAVLPMRYQDPILLAEAAATTDLLVDHRLDLAVATGANAAFDAVFGTVDTDARTEAQRRQDRFLAALEGRTLHTVDGPGQGAPEGTELKVTPHSPGLRSRIRQGAASVGSAVRAAELGIGLITGTVLHDLAEGETFGEYQARVIDAYRTTWRDKYGTAPPSVAVAASILPGTTSELRDTYAAYDRQRRTEGMHASRPRGALEPVVAADLPAGVRISRAPAARSHGQGTCPSIQRCDRASRPRLGCHPVGTGHADSAPRPRRQRHHHCVRQIRRRTATGTLRSLDE